MPSLQLFFLLSVFWYSCEVVIAEDFEELMSI